MLSYNNTTEQSIKDLYANTFTFQNDELWLFYDEDKSGNGIYEKVVVTYKFIDMGGGFMLDFYTTYGLSLNGNVDTLGGDKQNSIYTVLNTIQLHFTEQEFLDSLEV